MSQKKFLAFFVKFRISGPKNPQNQVFEPLEGQARKLKNDPQETWPNPMYDLKLKNNSKFYLFSIVINMKILYILK